MNIKTAVKYQINEYIKSIKVYYLVAILVLIFFGVLASINTSSSFNSTGGIEWSSIIFLFILGLNSFKETFLMMLQNGTTRKTMFVGRLITIGVTGAFMAIIDRFIVNVGGLMNNLITRYTVGGMYEEMFNARAETMHIVTLNLEAILITTGIYIVAMMFGYFTTTAYYRMNRMLKVAVSIGVPTTVMIILPLLDVTVFRGKIAIAINKILRFVFGGAAGNPYNLLLSCILCSVVGAGLTWLLIRKAVEKN